MTSRRPVDQVAGGEGEHWRRDDKTTGFAIQSGGSVPQKDISTAGETVAQPIAALADNAFVSQYRRARNRVSWPPANTTDDAAGPTAAAGASAEDAVAQPIPGDFPPVVYLPCAEAVDDPSAALIDMRQTRDGRMALLAYSALDRLHGCCGADQPWILMPTSELARLQAAQPFQLLLVDVPIPIEKRRNRR